MKESRVSPVIGEFWRHKIVSERKPQISRGLAGPKDQVRIGSLVAREFMVRCIVIH